MSFGLFEAEATSQDAEKRQVREAANKLAAATYDVRERFGHFLFAAKDLAEYHDRLALSKADILKTIEPHVFPRTGTVRRVLKPLEQEFKGMRQRTAMRRQAEDFDPYKNMGLERPPVNPNNTPDLLKDLSGFPVNTPPTPPNIPGLSNMVPPSPAPASPPSPQGSTPAASADPVGGGDGGGSDWSPNGNTDAIGAGDYEIQSGDTLTSISERSGISVDDLASGNDIANPDLIFAGDTLNIPGGTDTTTPDTTTTTPDATTTPDTSAPLAAEAPDPGTTTDLGASALANDAAAANAPIDNTNRTGYRRAASRRRRADFERNLDTDVTYHPHEGELDPEGDFKGYLSGVDQGAEGKVDRNFGGTFPGGSDHDMNPAETNFVKGATLRFARWCQANRLTASLATLERYSPPDREYIAIAATLQRVAGTHSMDDFVKGVSVNPYWGNTDISPGHMPRELKNQDGLTWPDAKRMQYLRDDMDRADPRPYDQRKKNRPMPPIPEPGRGLHRAEATRRSAAPGVPGSKPKGPEWNSKGKPKAPNTKPDLGVFDDEPTDNLPGGTAVTKVHAARRRYAQLCRQQGVRPTEAGFRRWAGKHDSPWDESADWFADTSVADPPELVRSEFASEPPMMKRVKNKGKHQARRRTAAPDYLQKADEALTNLLNQKAEEFQTSIAPLQQALQTVQQAEAEAQAANPLNVMPPAGTVNVLPEPPQGAGGGDPSGGGMDPNALAALMGGGDPSGGMSGDPSGGGAPPGLDPSAMGGAPPAAGDQGALPPELMGGGQQQMVARRRRTAGAWGDFNATGASLADIAKEHGVHPATLRDYSDLGNYTNHFDVPLKPQHEYVARGVAQKHWPKKKPKMAYFDPSSAQVGLTVARRGKGRGAARPRTAKNVDELWEQYSQQTTLRGGEPDVETFAQKYRVGPRALQRIRQKAMGG